jgi:SNF2 family DNA or RNA helicase
MYDFDFIELTDEQRYLLCNNILHRDLLGVSKYYGLSNLSCSLFEHPYGMLYKLEDLPKLNLSYQDSPFCENKIKSSLWNKLKNYIPKHFKETFAFEWKKEWNYFYKKCLSSENIYIKNQNIYPQIVEGKVLYCPITKFSDISSEELTEEIKLLFSDEKIYNKYSKILFSTMTFDLHKDSDISFISFLQNFFRIISLQRCHCEIDTDNKGSCSLSIDYSKLTLLEENQLRYLIDSLKLTKLSQKDIDNLSTLGIKTTSIEPQLLVEANIVDQNGSLFDSLWEFKWKIVIGNNSYNEKQFRELVQSKADIVKKCNVSEIMKKIKSKPNKMNHGELFRCYLLEKIHFDKGKEFLENLNRNENFELPLSIKTKLRPYQLTGFNWILSNLLNGFGVLLADEMGLGKTLQSICVLVYLLKHKLVKKKILILCPAILQITWLREIELHSNLKVKLIDTTGDADIIISSYEMYLSRNESLGFSFDCIILDEAQKIKNSSTKIWKALDDIAQSIKYRIAITGTPIENNLLDLWAIMQFVFPGFLGNKSFFQKEIIPNKEKLEKCIQPFVLRRKKVDCAIDLPNKIESVRFLELTIDQAALYQKCLETEMQEGDMTNPTVRFKLASHLKMICNHPDSFSKDFNSNYNSSNKCVFVKDFISQLTDEKVVIFTQYLEMGRILQKMLNCPFLCGEDSQYERQNKIDTFQTKDESKVIIISIRTGGMGITLTRASYVIMYDLWWNPSVIDQAIDRTHRIGQSKTVYVYTLITKGTIEEKIYNMLQKKKELQFIQSNEKWLTKMNDDELKNLFRLTS